MYYSRITLDLAKLPPGRLKELITKGSYALHQWVWLLFTDDETRKFLFREDSMFFLKMLLRRTIYSR